jgi:prevent-host-death family protein
MEVSAKELRQKTRLLLDAVERGEDVTITYRGRARARVVPMETEPDRAEADVGSELFGLWADREDLDDPLAWVRSLRQSR